MKYLTLILRYSPMVGEFDLRTHLLIAAFVEGQYKYVGLKVCPYESIYVFKYASLKR